MAAPIDPSDSPLPPPGSLRAWRMAARIRTLPAAAAPVFIGCGLAALRDAFSPLPAVAALVGALLIQIATNLANDYYDFVHGSDTEARIGPTRVTQAGLLEPALVRRGMIVTLGAALLVGVYLVWVGGWPIFWIGVASLVSAVAYTGGPFPLAYHGLGDLFVFVFFGLVAVSGTHYVQALEFTWEALWAGAGVGALSTAILVVNNLRDIPTDRESGKRTLAVRLGTLGTRLEYLAALLLGAVVPAIGVVGFGWPPAVLWTLPVFALAVLPVRAVLSFREPAELVPALGQTAALVALYGVVLGASLAWR